MLIAHLSGLYQALAPISYALLRIAVGLALVPHGLRNTFGMFPNTGAAALNLKELAVGLDRGGYRPGWFWARAISVTQLVGGPLLAVGLFSRPVAFVVLLFLVVANVERWRVGRYFWNKFGLEYTLMWTIAAFYVLVQGGGLYSIDHVLGWDF
jgi:putative oxidoreductase